MLRNAFYGWWITAAAFLVLFITVGLGLYVPPVFLVPLQEHFGWSRAAITAGGAVGALVTGIASPFVGVLIDRYGSRTVMVTGAVIMGSAFVLLGFMSALWHLYALNAVAAVGLACTAWIPTQTLISNWFEKKRGMAMGIALTGIGFGGLFMAPVAAHLIGRLGWRGAYAGLASLVFVIVVPVILAIVRSTPADLGLRPDGATAERTPTGRARPDALHPPPLGLELSDCVRTSAFWILSLAHFLWVFANLSIVMHLVAFLTDAGFQPHTAALALGLMVGASVGGRVIFGVVADRLTKRFILSAALLLHAVAALSLFTVTATAALPAFVVLFGLALGGTAVLVPLLVGECFGLLSFGKVLGLVMISATLGAALGPVLTGRIYDVTGSYHLAFTIHVAFLLAAALAVLFIARPDHAKLAAMRVRG